jgi:hypothetical protein
MFHPGYLAEIFDQLQTLSDATDSNTSAAEGKRSFDNSRTWTQINLLAQSTAASAQPSTGSIIDLSEELGYAACYLGKDQDEKNTLFRFTVPDIRYVFINPELENEIEQRQLTKFMSVARYPKLVSKTNQQGIKMLQGSLPMKDPGSGKSYAIYELKILGTAGSGGIRLLGTMISIRRPNAEKYNVYVFNTVWDKKELPATFTYPLHASLDAATENQHDASSSDLAVSSSSSNPPIDIRNRNRFIGTVPISRSQSSSSSSAKPSASATAGPMR